VQDQHAAVGRLGRVCRRWIYSAGLCFALNLDEQQRSGFAYGSVQREGGAQCVAPAGSTGGAGTLRGAEYCADLAHVQPGSESGDAPTMVQMCTWIGVSKSGYYEWIDRTPSAAARRRELLTEKIQVLFKAFDATYGYRRIVAELLPAGEWVGPRWSVG
jgi:hypothetical protein